MGRNRKQTGSVDRQWLYR